MKLLEKCANIAVIVGVAAFLFVIVRGELNKNKQSPPPRALVGKSVTLPGTQLNPQHNSLLVAISTQCHFCKDSLPFYKTLAERAQGKLDVIAVFPQPVAEAQSFLQQAQVAPTSIVSADFSKIGVQATPTMLLVDPHGKVLDEWMGKQDESGEQRVLARVLQ
jgi:thioredoxin-related protein